MGKKLAAFSVISSVPAIVDNTHYNQKLPNLWAKNNNLTNSFLCGTQYNSESQHYVRQTFRAHSFCRNILLPGMIF